MNQWIQLSLLCTSQIFGSQDSYALGVGEKASVRLDLQHAILGRDSEHHLLDAGLKRDMVVLEIGCGNGLTALWIASQVGENGRVIAVDKSKEQLEIAREKALEQGIKNIEFICCDAQDLDVPPNSIDLIYCRFLLMHLINPLSMLEKAFSFLKEGGIFAAQEPINSATYLCPDDPIFIEKMKNHLRNISLQRGVDYDIGKQLYTLFYQANYHPIQLHFTQPAVSIQRMKDLLRQFFEEIGPEALKAGTISEEELSDQLTSIGTYPENDGSYYVVPQQAHISGYKMVRSEDETIYSNCE